MRTTMSWLSAAIFGLLLWSYVHNPIVLLLSGICLGIGTVAGLYQDKLREAERKAEIYQESFMNAHTRKL